MTEYTPFELAKMFRAHIVLKAAEVFCYQSTLTDGIYNAFNACLGSKDFTPINPNDLTTAEMTELGFKVWDDGEPFQLIPLRLYPFLPDELEVVMISGEHAILNKSEIDTDHRFGVLSYGCIPKDHPNKC